MARSIFYLAHFSCWMDPSFTWPISVAGWIHLLPGPDLGCLPLPQCVVKDDTRLEVISAQQTSTAGAESKDPPCPPPALPPPGSNVCYIYIPHQLYVVLGLSGKQVYTVPRCVNGAILLFMHILTKLF